MRRQFVLPEEDEAFLNSSGHEWETVSDNGSNWVILHGFPVASGYTQTNVRVAIKIEAGYPRAPLDMAYFLPHLTRMDGKPINALTPCAICGEVYQRWSRHRTAFNPWQVGVDCLATHIGYVTSWFEAEFKKIPNAIPT